MMKQENNLLKIVLRSGAAFLLYSHESEIIELMSHPKFLKLKDNSKDVYVSIEDISAFQLLDEAETLGANESQQSAQESTLQA